MKSFALSSLLPAQVDAAPSRVVYELARLRDFDDPRLPVAFMVAGAVALVALACYLYRRDTLSVPRSVGTGLALLRCIALGGLALFFLGIERRATREVVHNSQVAVLVDVSQSMSLTDGDATTGENAPSRMDEVVATLANTPMIGELRQQHDLNVARFDHQVRPVVTLPKQNGDDQPASGAGAPKSRQRRPRDAVADDDQAAVSRAAASAIRLVSDPAEEKQESTAPTEESLVDWSAELMPQGTQTRIGDALAEQLRLYRGAPLAAIVVISDGAQNGGIDASAAVAAAREANVPVYSIGVGSTRPRRNLAVSDLLVPARAFPGDTANITGYLQASGYSGRFVDVELRRRSSEEPADGGTIVASQRVQVGADGEIVPVIFEIDPDAPGRFVFQLRALAPADDANPRDNRRESDMDVVDRETRVLLFASGPSREYRFLRNQLHRDATMKVDVLLQSAQPGISQDANQILADFPSTREELFQYDCLVAFDADWTRLDADQVALVESWVSEEAGGMIVVPGPIHTANWVRSTEHAKLRDLHPVVFQQRLTLLDDGQYGGETAWPLEFERAGRDARFLWLANSADESALAWSSFPGVYGYYAVKGEKPGATVYARVTDPESRLGDPHPVFMAGQFYGAGQVLYIGSGEFWRLRASDPAYFEVLYTKLIRHISQGRLLRSSSRGALLVDRDRYELGETVVFRARLTDARLQPLAQESVAAQVARPDGSTEPVKLLADTQRPGVYVGQFSAYQEGTYQLALAVPDSNEEPLSKYIQVRVPDLERARAERNETLLRGLSNDTGGRYYPRLEWAAFGNADLMSLADSIPNRSEVKLLKGAPDQRFAQLQMRWLLGIIAGALFLEWIVRRVNRLA